VSLALALLVALPTAQSRPVFGAEIGLVLLQATVKNGRGELVSGLDRTAFTVYENGKAQAVTLFRSEDAPVSLGLLLDNSRSMRPKRASVEAAALALVRASNPEDEVFLLNFGDRPTIDVPFTRDLDALRAGISRREAIGGTALWDALQAGETYVAAHASHQRKALLVVTDGKDNASASSIDAAREEARRNGAVIYAIGLLPEDGGGGAGHARHELDELTEQTGGLAYYPRTLDDVGAVAADLARQIRSQYTIGYSPANEALDGSYRRIRVVAKGSGRLSVRTRAGYRVISGGSVPSPYVGRGRVGGR
jgi:Ca-activated chloride channel homolog